MDLIHFDGLNCYNSCIVNAAEFLNVDYLASFTALWSETDFSYDEIFDMYLTTRMPSALEKLGLKLNRLPCSAKHGGEPGFAGLKSGTLFTAGMDAFYMPWNQYYKLLRGYHYFLGRKVSDNLICCFDPTYNISDVLIAPDEILPHVFDMAEISSCCSKAVVKHDVVHESYEVLETLPELFKRLDSKIKECSGVRRSKAGKIGKYVDAMYTNRSLYRHYLEQLPDCPDALTTLFDDELFSQWTAVKYGLYKASLMQDNTEILEKICTKLYRIIELERAAAEEVFFIKSSIQSI